MSELRIEGLVVVHAGSRRTDAMTAVRDVDLVVPSGETVGLVGESGCGKSTLARSVVGLVPAAAGSITLDGQQLVERGRARLRRYNDPIQVVYQDPGASLNPRMTIGETIMEAVRRKARRPRPDVRAASRELLERVGVATEAFDRFPHQYSGGQLQRIAIARALALDPAVLIADEPTSSLDVSVQAVVLNLLKDLQRELGLSMLFISHDIAVVRYMSHTIAVMHQGEVVETAATEHLIHAPSHPYTRSLLESIPGDEPGLVEDGTHA